MRTVSVAFFFVAVIVQVFLCNFYFIPSDSMAPTITAGDFIMAEKWTYDARIFTDLQFTRRKSDGRIFVL
ncbi:MAG: S26 family signal peptidase [Bacteroidales bacterium]|nr:S26 family signal peptidase [Bacteroidales bacterium]